MMMLFTFILAVAQLAQALRPVGYQEGFHQRLVVTQSQGMVLIADMTILRDRLDALVQAEALDEEGQEATQVLADLVGARNATETMLLQMQNATEHIDDEGEEHLESITEIIRTKIYSSMDQSSKVEQMRLDGAVKDIQDCNEHTEVRLSEGGDIYHLEEKAVRFQQELDDLRGSLHEFNSTNESAWQEVSFYVKFLPHAPDCPNGYDVKRLWSIDEFVNDDEYKEQLARQKKWYNEVQEGFNQHYKAWQDAHEAFGGSHQAIDIARAKLGVEWCIWHMMLTAGCKQHDDCFEREVAFFKDLVERVKANEQNRKDAFAAGEKVLAHIGYLLAHHDFPEEDLEVDTSRYDLTYPEAPEETECDVHGFTTQPHWEQDLECDHNNPASTPME